MQPQTAKLLRLMGNKPMQQIQNNSNASDPDQSDNTKFSLIQTRPQLAGESLVEQMQYLYVRVVRARDMALCSGVELVAEVKLGSCSGITKTAALSNIEWDQFFAFSKECIQSSTVEIIVKESNEEDYKGRIWFDLSNVPRRLPADNQLAPQWYRMEDKTGDKAKTGELMVSIWFGTQDDEAFADAWHSEAAIVPFGRLSFIKSKVYHSPKLWYLRVSVIEAEHIMPGHKGPEVVRFPEFSARVQVGDQHLRTRRAAPSDTRSFSNPYWNEDLLFVVEEPFVDSLLVSVEDKVGLRSDEVMAKVELPVAEIEKRADERPVTSGWFNLESHFGKAADNNNKPSTRFVPRVHLRLSFDGGYHVFDDVPLNSSDGRPTDTTLWKPHIGVLEMQILGARGLMPMNIKDSEEDAINAYCIAKYGQKWCRTRTVVDSLSPKWNEQYNWEVYDLCTVVTVGVFDNGRIIKNNKNARASDCHIGKVRIRLSTLETDRVYTHFYPLLILSRSGVKKMGELHLAIRISSSDVTNMLLMYTKPFLPKMHYVEPLIVSQLQSLRNQAKNLLASRLSREEPPLGGEVVEYMLDGPHGQMWSMRRSKANIYRLRATFSGFLAMGRAVKAIRDWHKPVYSALFLMIFVTLVMLPEFIIPFIFLYMVFLGLQRYFSRPRHPVQMCTRFSGADEIHPDDLDEEFDMFPTSCPADIVKTRYDRLREEAGRFQTVIGDVVAELERFQALVSWRDPRATFLFLVLCLVAAVAFYFVSIRVVIALFGLYSLRPPWFRSKLPSAALSFLRRLPSKSDNLL